MLAQEVANRHPGRVVFVEENFGDSELAERYGVEQYPTVFVDEALVATPWDFFEWPGNPVGPKGRYVPWLKAESRERFLQDLDGFVARRLRGETIEGVENRVVPPIAAFPSFEAETLGGETRSAESLRGRVVVVEFWATWCPPCRSTLSFLGELERRWEGRVAVLAVAVSSPEDEVAKLLSGIEGAPSDALMGTDELVSKFGGVLAVPTLMVFGPDGDTAGVFYGAPPELHDRVGELVEGLLAGKKY